MRPFALVVALALVLAVPSVATAQQNPFAPDAPAPLPEPQPQPQPVAPVAPAGQDDGLDGWQQLLILGAAVLLLGGIAVGILTDARRAAPARSSRPTSADPADGTGERRPQARARKRKKSKAARAARKRNR